MEQQQMDQAVFSGVYTTDHLRRALEIIPTGYGVVVTFKASGYATTVTCSDADGVEISASISPDWARGSTYRELQGDQRAELIERLTNHGPKVRVTVSNGRIDLGIPT